MSWVGELQEGGLWYMGDGEDDRISPFRLLRKIWHQGDYQPWFDTEIFFLDLDFPESKLPWIQFFSSKQIHQATILVQRCTIWYTMLCNEACCKPIAKILLLYGNSNIHILHIVFHERTSLQLKININQKSKTITHHE